MAHRIEDYFPTTSPPNLRVKNIAAPPASAARPDPSNIAQALTPVRDLLVGKTLAFITGAGLSTDSGLPDYRSPGSPPRHPITLQQFMGDYRWRRHYWARNHQGWFGPQLAQPNAGHFALAELEHRGVVNGLITQNVDRLHSRAGSRNVVDLHGRYNEVLCTECGEITSRQSLHERLEALNPGFRIADPRVMDIAPDADASVADTTGFRIVNCLKCGGILRTNVVFFGGKVPHDDVVHAREIVSDADALVVAGSSLAVGSAMRFVRQAAKENKPVVMINRGPTRGDKYATLNVHIGTSTALPWLAQHL
ncbi:MAG: NAD-dependent deacetylase [Actinomycetaceae bacterium]|nr:NAD-dependent deacetylase [Actinomycetaceae bacterium]